MTWQCWVTVGLGKVRGLFKPQQFCDPVYVGLHKCSPVALWTCLEMTVLFQATSSCDKASFSHLMIRTLRLRDSKCIFCGRKLLGATNWPQHYHLFHTHRAPGVPVWLPLLPSRGRWRHRERLVSEEGLLPPQSSCHSSYLSSTANGSRNKRSTLLSHPMFSSFYGPVKPLIPET